MSFYQSKELIIYDDQLKCLLFWKEHPNNPNDFKISNLAPILKDSLNYYDRVQKIIKLDNNMFICLLNNNYLAIY